MYVLNHMRLNRDLETKKHNQITTKNTICRSSARGKQEPKISFTHVLSNIVEDLYI